MSTKPIILGAYIEGVSKPQSVFNFYFVFSNNKLNTTMNKRQIISTTDVSTSTQEASILSYPHITLESLSIHNNINANVMATNFRRYNKIKNQLHKSDLDSAMLDSKLSDLDSRYSHTLQYYKIKKYLKSSHSTFYAIHNNNIIGPYTTRTTAMIRQQKELYDEQQRRSLNLPTNTNSQECSTPTQNWPD